LALHSDGTIDAWGWDDFGTVSGAPTAVGYSQVAAGVMLSLALRAENTGSAYCFGDGTGTACPCGANGNPGEGCANTGGVGGATLTATGSAYINDETLQFHVVGVPGTKPGLILRAANQLNGGLGAPIGDGLLCVFGSMARSDVQETLGGATTFSDFKGSPFGDWSFGAGVPTNYQFWYRDSSNTCSGWGFNLSNAWTVTWEL